MKRASRWPWIGVALLLAFVACGPGEIGPRFYRADFEETCDGVPCGWERTSGEPHQAVWIETIHPGEHGLRLVGEVNVRGPGSSAEDRVSPEFLAALLTARCDPGNQIRIDVVLADEGGDTFDATVTLTPSEEWEAPREAGFSLVTFPGTNATRVIAVGLAKTGPGVCEISELVIDERGFVAPGC